MSIDKLKQKFVTGAFISDVKHYFTKINEIIDWINNNNGSSLTQTLQEVTDAGNTTTNKITTIDSFSVDIAGLDAVLASSSELTVLDSGLNYNLFKVDRIIDTITKNGVDIATVNDILGGATGSFTTNDGKTITVTDGRITAIV